MFKNLISASFCVFLLATLNVAAEQKELTKPGAVVAGVVSVEAKVEAIDYKTRMVTLKDKEGGTRTLHVGEQARNLDQVKVGDNVKIAYVEAVAVEVQKAEGELAKEVETSIQRAPKGAKPSGVISQTVRLKVEVVEIDYAARTISVKGPEGQVLSLKVSDQVKRLEEVKKGDRVAIAYSEALGVSVTKP